MRAFKNKWFTKFAHRHRIGDGVLLDAVERANQGLVDADLGGSLIKQRIARRNEGKSGGFRSLILFKRDQRAFFVFGFAKSSLDNLTDKEILALKMASDRVMKLSDLQLKAECDAGAWMEMKDAKEKVQE